MNVCQRALLYKLHSRFALLPNMLTRCRDGQGRTPADLLQATRLLPESADMPALRKALGAPAPSDAGAKPPTQLARSNGTLQAAALREIEPAAGRDSGYGAVRESGLTPAAQLSQAQTPEDTAAVFKDMPPDHQRLRLRMWAALLPDELAHLRQLSEEAKEQLAEVRRLVMRASSCACTVALCGGPQCARCARVLGVMWLVLVLVLGLLAIVGCAA